MRIDPVRPSPSPVVLALASPASEAPVDRFQLSDGARKAARVVLESPAETREREILFRFRARESVTATPTPMADGSFYVGSCDRSLYRVSSAGAPVWEKWTGALIYCEPAVAPDGTVYVGNNDGTLFAFSPTGEEKWKKETHGAIRARVALDGAGSVYLRGDDDRLRCLSSEGAERWKVDAPQSVSLKSSPSVTPSGDVVLGEEAGCVRAFSASGEELWSRRVGEGPVPPPAVGSDGTVYAATAEGRLVALAPDGSVRWDLDLGGSAFEVGPFVGRDGRVYVHDLRDRFTAVEPGGTVAWTRPFEEERLARQPAVDAAGRVYLNVDHEVWRLDARGEVDWKFRPDEGDELWTSPVLRDDGSLLVGGKKGVVYGVRPVDLQAVDVEAPGEILPEEGFVRIGGIRLPIRAGGACAGGAAQTGCAGGACAEGAAQTGCAGGACAEGAAQTGCAEGAAEAGYLFSQRSSR